MYMDACVDIPRFLCVGRPCVGEATEVRCKTVTNLTTLKLLATKTNTKFSNDQFYLYERCYIIILKCRSSVVVFFSMQHYAPPDK